MISHSSLQDCRQFAPAPRLGHPAATAKAARCAEPQHEPPRGAPGFASSALPAGLAVLRHCRPQPDSLPRWRQFHRARGGLCPAANGCFFPCLLHAAVISQCPAGLPPQAELAPVQLLRS